MKKLKKMNRKKKQMAIHGDICGDMNIRMRASAILFFLARHNEFVTRHDRALLAFESRFRFNPDRNSFI